MLWFKKASPYCIMCKKRQPFPFPLLMQSTSHSFPSSSHGLLQWQIRSLGFSRSCGNDESLCLPPCSLFFFQSFPVRAMKMFSQETDVGEKYNFTPFHGDKISFACSRVCFFRQRVLNMFLKSVCYRSWTACCWCEHIIHWQFNLPKVGG